MDEEDGICLICGAKMEADWFGKGKDRVLGWVCAPCGIFVSWWEEAENV